MKTENICNRIFWNPLQFIISSVSRILRFFLLLIALSLSFSLCFFSLSNCPANILICELKMSSHINEACTLTYTHTTQQMHRRVYVSYGMFMTFVSTHAQESAVTFVPFRLLCGCDNTIRLFIKH